MTSREFYKFVVTSLVGVVGVSQMGYASPITRQYSLVLWNWTQPCSNLQTFSDWVSNFKSIGGTTITISVPWNQIEPQQGQFNFSYISQRLAITQSYGMNLKVEINSYYSGAQPSWLNTYDFWGSNGQPITGSPASYADTNFSTAYDTLSTNIAAEFKGDGITYTPFIGPDAELKYGGWSTYDPASLQLWQQSVNASTRPSWLASVVGNAPLPQTPPVPGPTIGTPDQTPADTAFIAFRQQLLRTTAADFVNAVHAGDPNAQISVPLGEGYRSESAAFANQDYYGLSLGANAIAHSWDFNMHSATNPSLHQSWQAAASVAAFEGITGLPTTFEFDSPATMQAAGFSTAQIEQIGTDVLAAGGSGFQAANFSYYSTLPSQYPYLVALGKELQTAPAPAQPPPNHTILLFLSNWANYDYRESTQWVYQAQFGAWQMLKQNGYAVRIINESDLSQNLSGYRGLYVAFSPPQLLPSTDAAELYRLESSIPTIIEYGAIPGVKSRAGDTYATSTFGTVMTTDSALPIMPLSQTFVTGPGNIMTIGYPLGYMWTFQNNLAQERAFQLAAQDTFGSPAVPEPASLALFGAGVAVVLSFCWRRLRWNNLG